MKHTSIILFIFYDIFMMYELENVLGIIVTIGAAILRNFCFMCSQSSFYIDCV